ncbi:hypothetical protein HER39_07725, partial [Arthrobacter deserti]|nr:hypothetical protein [Arthrobacter deserti]
PGDAAGHGKGAAPTRDAAIAASSRLDQQQHSAVYSMIARGHGLGAMQAYRKATGVSLRDAASAVASMSAFPQPYAFPGFPQVPRPAGPGDDAAEPEAQAAPDAHAAPEPAQESATGPVNEPAPPERREQAPETAEPAPEPPAAARPAGPASAAGGSPAPAPGSTEAEGKPAPAGGSSPAATGVPAHKATAYRYRAIVSNGDEIREIASTRLNDEVYGRIRETALGGDLQSAARLLMGHSEAGEQEALDFVALIGPEED